MLFFYRGAPGDHGRARRPVIFAHLRYAAAVLDMGIAPAPDAEVRGVLLAVLALGADASSFAPLDGGRGAACLDAWRALHGLDDVERRRLLADWQAEATSVIPKALARLHPTWCERALAGEHRDIVTAIAAAGPGARELARMAFGPLFPLCEATPGPLGERLCRLSFDALQVALTRRGARLLGRSLAWATPRLRARAMAAVGEPWATELAAAAAEPASDDERAAAVTLVAAAETQAWHSPRERLLELGLTAVKAELAAEGQGSVLALAGRLPAPLGRRLVGW